VTTDAIDRVALDQVLNRVKAIQHCVTEAKQLADKQDMVGCIERLRQVGDLVVFDPCHLKLIEAIQKRYAVKALGEGE